MKKLLIALAAAFIAVASYGQGQVVFANKVGAVGLDAPVTFTTDNTKGPGADWSVQLFLVGANNSFTALTPPSTFRAVSASGAEKYWFPQTITIDGNTGTPASFVVRAWATSLGSFDAAQKAQAGFGQSAPFTVTPALAPNPPANLTTLTAFQVIPVPEPSVIALGVLGAAALVLRRRK